jgi:hypothetical protein
MMKPNPTGRVSFGFNSKYQRGATVPTGNTEFQFRAADFNFKSTSYDWLVVGGAKAQFKGSGTINNTGNYGFLLTAIDGQINGGQDKFRIKIWDKTTNVIIYDNQFGSRDKDNPATVIRGVSLFTGSKITEERRNFPSFPSFTKNMSFETGSDLDKFY